MGGKFARKNSTKDDGHTIQVIGDVDLMSNLFKTNRRSCRFYFGKGCLRGDSCPFSHETDETTNIQPPTLPDGVQAVAAHNAVVGISNEATNCCGSAERHQEQPASQLRAQRLELSRQTLRSGIHAKRNTTKERRQKRHAKRDTPKEKRQKRSARGI